MVERPNEWEAWLSAPVQVALALQRPLPGGQTQIVASGQRKDGGTSAEAS
jgi:hypothetical protein